jgi:hypothetical protein
MDEPIGPEPHKWRISTSGDFSPGYVGGNYVVYLTGHLAQEFAASKLKQWRKIESLKFLWPGSIEDAVGSFRTAIGLAGEILKSRNQPFGHFTASFSAGVAASPLKCHQFQCVGNQPELFQEIRAVQKRWVLNTSEATDKGDDSSIRLLKNKMLEEQRRIHESWSIGFHMNIFDWNWHAVQFSCDYLNRRVELSSEMHYNLDPATYPNHLTTTSDVIAWLVAMSRTHDFAFVDHFELVWRNYPLTKLFCYLLDHGSVDWSRIQFGDSDYEVWDYVYPEFDHEVERARSKP